MLNTSHRNLKIFSAFFWYAGAIVLILKGIQLLVSAYELKPDPKWILLAIFAGLGIGTAKAKFLFIKNCNKNLTRIDTLTEPKIWQFFRPGFFAFLILMITAGATLSTLAQNNYTFLVGIAILDVSIATALMGSSYIFWSKKPS